MPIKTKGFGDDTLQEQDVARIFANTGVRYSFPGDGNFEPSVVLNQRQVRIGIGVHYAGIIECTNPAVFTADIPAAAAGRWHLIVDRLIWPAQTIDTVLYQQRTAQIVVIPGPTTTTDTPSIYPEFFPTAMKTSPGVALDVPIAWVWTKAGSTNLSLFDIRNAAPTDRLRALERRISAPNRDILIDLTSDNAIHSSIIRQFTVGPTSFAVRRVRLSLSGLVGFAAQPGTKVGIYITGSGFTLDHAPNNDDRVTCVEAGTYYAYALNRDLTILAGATANIEVRATIDGSNGYYRCSGMASIYLDGDYRLVL